MSITNDKMLFKAVQCNRIITAIYRMCDKNVESMDFVLEYCIHNDVRPVKINLGTAYFAYEYMSDTYRRDEIGKNNVLAILYHWNK